MCVAPWRTIAFVCVCVLLTVVVTTTRKKWIGREKEKESKYNK